MARVATIGFLILGAIPLVIYPGIIVADVMAIAAAGGHLKAPGSIAEWLNAYIIVGATLYPVVWTLALIRTIAMLRGRNDASAIKSAVIPLVFLCTLPLAWVTSDALSG